MNHEFGNIGRRLPYDLPEHRLEALHERILRNTAARPAPAARTRRLYLAAGVSVAAALLATGILLSGHLSHRAECSHGKRVHSAARKKALCRSKNADTTFSFSFLWRVQVEYTSRPPGFK